MMPHADENHDDDDDHVDAGDSDSVDQGEDEDLSAPTRP